METGLLAELNSCTYAAEADVGVGCILRCFSSVISAYVASNILPRATFNHFQCSIQAILVVRLVGELWINVINELEPRLSPRGTRPLSDIPGHIKEPKIVRGIG